MGAEPQPRWTGGPKRLRFGVFELDARSGELWKAGARARLQLQPSRVLSLLARRPGELLTREEIQREVWPEGTFVDFEQSLNFCIRQIRGALGDDATTPRYVETLPRRGYRFIAPVHVVGGEAEPNVPGGRTQGPGVLPPSEDREPEPIVLRALPSLAPGRVRGQRRAAVALAALAGVAAGAAAMRIIGGSVPAPPAFQRVTFGRGYVASARFGPEGQVLYTAAWEGRAVAGFLLRTASLDTRELPDLSGRVLSVSRPGDLLFLVDKTLSRAPLAGGPAKPLLEGVLAADATPDGEELAVARAGGSEARIEFPLGHVLGSALRPSCLRLSRDGAAVALLEHPLAGDDRGHLVVFDRTGRRRVLTEDWASLNGLAWSPSGQEVWFTAARVGADSALHAVDLAGRVRTVVPALGRLVLHDVSADGLALLERTVLKAEVRFRGPAETDERDLSWLDLPRIAQVARGGRSVLFYESGEGGGPAYATYLRSTDSAVPVRIGTGRAMSLSADGRVAVSLPVAAPDRVDLLPTGAGEVRSMRETGIAEFQWAALTPDGAALVFTGAAAGGRPRVYLKPLAGGRARALTPEGVGVWSDGLAPDGSMVAAADDGHLRLYPLDGGAARDVADSGGMSPVGWQGASVLVARDQSRIPARLFRFDLRAGRREPWRELAPTDHAGIRQVGAVAIAPDVPAYAYSYVRQVSDLYAVSGLR